MRKRLRLYGKERGQTLVIVVLAMVGLIAFLALVIDGGMAFAARRQMQNAADAAALAGTRELRNGATEQAIYDAVVQYAQANGVDDPADLEAWFVNESEEHTGTSPLPGNGSIPSDAVGVEVSTTTSFPSSFARIVGRDELQASASATAIVWGTVSCGILAEHDIKLHRHGGPGAIVRSACIHANHDIELQQDTLLEGNAEAVNIINNHGTIDGDATAEKIKNKGTITGVIDETPADYVTLPVFDFETYRQIAESEGTYFAKKKDFEDYLEAHNYVITGTFYVDDNVEIKKNETITIYGTLVTPHQLKSEGTYTHYATGSHPAILAEEVHFTGSKGGATEIHGWIYAPIPGHEVHFHRSGHPVRIYGGIIAWTAHLCLDLILEEEGNLATGQGIKLVR